MQITPFPFQEQLRNYFKEQNKIWNFFSSYKVKEEEYQHFKTDILKNTYRLTSDLHPTFHAIITEIKEKFELTIPVFLYQEQNNTNTNASVYYLNSEAHIIISGSILDTLSVEELKVVLGHELGHVLLYSLQENNFQTTERIINAITDDMRSPSSYYETARIYDLYTELFCDYASYLACGNRNLVIQTLVKVYTGLEKVFAEEYLEQVNEIFSKNLVRSNGNSHPEIYYRVKSLELLCLDFEKGKKTIEAYIEGNATISELHIFDQKKWQTITYKWIQIILNPPFMKSSLNLNHAKTFFPSFQENNSIEEENEQLISEIGALSIAKKEYLSYVLLDFVLLDSELFDYSLIWTLQISEAFELTSEYEKILKKELALSELSFKDQVKKSRKEFQLLPHEQMQGFNDLATYSSKKIS